MSEDTDDAVLGARYSWEFFISHVRADTPVASRLKDALHPPAAVFLDAEQIAASDQWRSVLRNALRSSLIYVFLIPLKGESYTWQDEEMTIADHLYRKNQKTRRIVPIYLGRNEVPPADEVPFGLARFPGMAVPDLNDLSAARQELIDTLGRIKPLEAKRLAREEMARQDAVRVASGGWRALLSTDAIGFAKPVLIAVSALIVVTALALIGCAIASIWMVGARGAMFMLAALLAALIVVALLILSAVLTTVVQINRRGIKGG